MEQEILTDAISGVHVTGNLVRIDLTTLQPHLKSDNGQLYSILINGLLCR